MASGGRAAQGGRRGAMRANGGPGPVAAALLRGLPAVVVAPATIVIPIVAAAVPVLVPVPPAIRRGAPPGRRGPIPPPSWPAPAPTTAEVTPPPPAAPPPAPVVPVVVVVLRRPPAAVIRRSPARGTRRGRGGVEARRNSRARAGAGARGRSARAKPSVHATSPRSRMGVPRGPMGEPRAAERRSQVMQEAGVGRGDSEAAGARAQAMARRALWNLGGGDRERSR